MKKTSEEQIKDLLEVLFDTEVLIDDTLKGNPSRTTLLELKQLVHKKRSEYIKMDIEYYKTIPGEVEHYGERYFKVVNHSEKIIEVCVQPRGGRTGKNNIVGVYLIKYNTFIGNYNYKGSSKLVDSTKEEFDEKLHELINELLK